MFVNQDVGPGNVFGDGCALECGRRGGFFVRQWQAWWQYGPHIIMSSSGASAASGLARRAQGYLTKQDLTSLFLQPESVGEMVLEGWDLVEFDDPGVVYQSV